MATAASSIVRSRSTRVESGKLAQATSTRSATTTTPASAVSHLSTFLTNLRLLDLDLQPEWPDINAATFSTKDAAQGQKRRIQCVEWALYQLFCLWDPEEARNKLRPFFPPLDQVQSLNLRAALLRSLESAKKSGVLGRDAVIRKTMLDECKGERFEEVLAVFSSAVLKKLVAQSGEYCAPLAQSMALENRGYAGDRTQLTALAVTHRASLGRMLREKHAAREQFDDFADLLRLKERSLLRRREQTKERPAKTSEDANIDARRVVRNNWSGHERWMDMLLCGDAGTHREGLLSASFDRVWRRVEAGRLAELEDETGGLMEELDGRVKAQRERLEKWRRFHREVLHQTGNEVAEPLEPGRERGRQRGVDLGFGAHENLHLGRSSPRKLPRKGTSGEYRDLVSALEDELAGSVRIGSLTLRHQPKSREGTPTEDVVSELDDHEDMPPDDVPEIVAPSVEPKIAPSASPDPLLDSERIKTAEERHNAKVVLQKPQPESARQLSATARPSTPPSPTQEIADRILASVNAASPSPKKPRHTLSLAERTRLSMARRGSHMALDEESDPLPLRQTAAASAADPVESDPEDGLVARTRRSMAGLEAAQQRAQLERRRSQRKLKVPQRREGSAFPVVDEEGDSTVLLTEELITGDVGYEAVFMSRPKIKTSPVGTPVREGYE